MAYLLKNKTKEEIGCDFLALSKKESDARMRLRLLCLEHLLEGKSYRQVAAIFKIETSTVQCYVNKFRNGGIEGLKDKPGKGRKPKFPRKKEEYLKELILDEQKKMIGGRLIGKDIQRLIAETFGIKLSLAGIYLLLERIGLTWVSSRSQHPKKNKSYKTTSKKILWQRL